MFIHYLDLPSAKPLKVFSFVTSLGLFSNILSSSSILFKISKASNIASFLVAAAFFNLSAEISGPKSIIGSLATLINSSTATCPADLNYKNKDYL